MNYYQQIQQALLVNGATLRQSNFAVILTLMIQNLMPNADGTLTISDPSGANCTALKGNKAGGVPTKVTVLKAQRSFTKSNGTQWATGESLIIWE
jgi:hypothetical protein